MSYNNAAKAGNRTMLDLLFAGLTVTFFALCWALLALCDQLSMGQGTDRDSRTAM
jgi:hypothetical protein